MKKFQLIALLIIVVGFMLKLTHLPAASITMLVGVALQFIHSIIYLIINAKKKIGLSLLNISFSLMNMLILEKLLFQNFGPYWMLAAFIVFLTITGFTLYFVNHGKPRAPIILLIFYFFLFFAFIPVHSDTIYHYLYLNKVFCKDGRENSFYGENSFYCWDKYSWFLYGSHKQEEALRANEKSQKILEKYLMNSKQYHQFFLLEQERLKSHAQHIRNNDWEWKDF